MPAARSGIAMAVMLGMGRAIGETMAVMMVTGNAARMPLSLGSIFMPVRTMTATVAAEMGEVANGSVHYHALFGIGIILFILTFMGLPANEYLWFEFSVRRWDGRSPSFRRPGI